jgi:Flp pilus assembly protein TadG
MQLNACRFKDPGTRRWARPAAARAGAAALEFAVIVPFLATVLVGMVELSRAVMAKEVLTNASRRGAATGIKAGKTYTDIQNAVDDILSTDGQLPATIANGKAHLVVTVATWNSATSTYGTDTVVDSSTFAPNQYDKVSVKVWANASDCNLLFLNYMSGKIEGEWVVMMKQ